MEAIGFIGFGGIAESVLTTLKDEVEGELNIAGILVREAKGRPEQLPFVADLAKLINRRPRVIAECASHEAVRSYGEDVLRSGVDLIVVSTGALADSALYDRLQTAAYDAGSKLILPSGAIGAVKSNIGHLDAAAGVAGLIKTVLCLKHAELVPTRFFGRPNSQIDFERDAFSVSAELRAW